VLVEDWHLDLTPLGRGLLLVVHWLLVVGHWGSEHALEHLSHWVLVLVGWLNGLLGLVSWHLEQVLERSGVMSWHLPG